jgi:hypothetical protein
MKSDVELIAHGIYIDGVHANFDLEEDAVREITIHFPTQADFIRQRITTQALQNFMTVNTFTGGGVNETTHAATASTLASVTYEFVRQAGNYITIKVGGEAEADDLIIRIDASTYSIFNGKRLDTNNDGIPGQNLDNVYLPVGSPSDWYEPGSQHQTFDWVFDISAGIGNAIDPGSLTAANHNASDATVASLQILNLSAFERANVGSGFPANFKLQGFRNGVWAPVSTARWEEAQIQDGANNIVFVDFAVREYEIIRLIWDGGAHFKTREVFGKAQPVEIIGMDAMDRPLRLAMPEVVGDVKVWYNSGRVTMISDFLALDTRTHQRWRDGSNIVLAINAPAGHVWQNPAAQIQDNITITREVPFSPQPGQLTRFEPVSFTAALDNRPNTDEDDALLGSNRILLTLDPDYIGNIHGLTFQINRVIGYRDLSSPENARTFHFFFDTSPDGMERDLLAQFTVSTVTDFFLNVAY